MNKIFMAMPLLFAVSICAYADTTMATPEPMPSPEVTQPSQALPDAQEPVNTCPGNTNLTPDPTPDVPSDGGAPPVQGL